MQERRSLEENPLSMVQKWKQFSEGLKLSLSRKTEISQWINVFLKQFYISLAYITWTKQQVSFSSMCVKYSQRDVTCQFHAISNVLEKIDNIENW